MAKNCCMCKEICDNDDKSVIDGVTYLFCNKCCVYLKEHIKALISTLIRDNECKKYQQVIYKPENDSKSLKIFDEYRKIASHGYGGKPLYGCVDIFNDRKFSCTMCENSCSGDLLIRCTHIQEMDKFYPRFEVICDDCFLDLACNILQLSSD